MQDDGIFETSIKFFRLRGFIAFHKKVEFIASLTLCTKITFSKKTSEYFFPENGPFKTLHCYVRSFRTRRLYTLMVQPETYFCSPFPPQMLLMYKMSGLIQFLIIIKQTPKGMSFKTQHYSPSKGNEAFSRYVQ